MTLRDGKHAVPAGKLAAVVTSLDMVSPPATPTVAAPQGATLDRITQPDSAWYLSLFRAIGAPWLWTSRLKMPADELDNILSNPDVHIHVVRQDGQDIGLVELDYRHPDQNEIAFFGLIPTATGQGYGRWMMDQAITMAFAHRNTRLFLHTCTLDSPAVLPFYQRCGFRAYKREVDIWDDPRADGTLPRTAAAHIPVLAADENAR